jgi:hypothetical protein
MAHTYLVICGGSSHINIIYHFLVLQLITLKIFRTKLAVKIRLCLHRGCIFVNNCGRKSATKHSADCIVEGLTEPALSVQLILSPKKV